jgi:hypothetical protein
MQGEEDWIENGRRKRVHGIWVGWRPERGERKRMGKEKI